jgi:hypothetical protein
VRFLQEKAPPGKDVLSPGELLEDILQALTFPRAVSTR